MFLHFFLLAFKLFMNQCKNSKFISGRENVLFVPLTAGDLWVFHEIYNRHHNPHVCVSVCICVYLRHKK